MTDVEDLLRRALKLPPGARAALVGMLLEGLDFAMDADAAAAWAAEIQRRLGEIDAGAVTLVPWSEARRRIFGLTSDYVAFHSEVVDERCRGGLIRSVSFAPTFERGDSTAVDPIGPRSRGDRGRGFSVRASRVLWGT